MVVCTLLEDDIANAIQLASQTEQDLYVATHTDIAVDVHACGNSQNDI
jgi:hypothetical protein